MSLSSVAPNHASRPINHGPTVPARTEHQGCRKVMAAAWPMPVVVTPPRIAAVVDTSGCRPSPQPDQERRA